MEKADHSEIDRKLGELTQWMKDHEVRDAETRAKVAELPTKGDIAEIVQNTLRETLLSAGKWSKATIITIAVIIGSLGVISGGFKAILGWIGFVQLK